MKKLLCALLALVMVAGCSSGNTTTTTTTTGGSEGDASGYTGDKEYVFTDSFEDYNMDYLTTALASDHELNANLIDGLLETDSYGNFVPCIAESYEANEDSTVWTFKIRPGVKWFASTGEEYAEVTANDFVAGLRHAAEFGSGTAWVLEGIVKGFSDYMANGDWSDEAWANVGVEATDDYTLVYTMEKPTPFFYTITTYSCLFPVEQSFLESKGEGCKLGAPDTNNCTFGTGATPDSILYNGGYFLTSYDVKSSYVLSKNPGYWDADHVYLETVKCVFNDGSDLYMTMNGFEEGTYAAAALNTQWPDYDTYAEKYAEYTTASLPNGYAFGIIWNYNRATHELTNTPDKDFDMTQKAIRNENFRKAVRSAFDVQKYLEVTAPADVAAATIRNVNSVPTLVSTSDGTPYVNLIMDAYKEATGVEVDLNDGQYPWLDKEAALEYIEAAKADGIEFPIHLDMLVIETNESLKNKALSMADSISANTDGQIIIEPVMKDQNTVYNVAYYATDPSECDYDISTFSGWGPDYADPKTFVDIYSPITGYYMSTCGLTDNTSDHFGADDDIKTELGFYEYQKLYEAADAITDDMDARYAAFAKADAYLLEHALYIPTSQQSRSIRVSCVVPFTAEYSVSGITQYKYKNMQLTSNHTIITAEEYNAAYEAWLKGGN